MRPPSVIDWLPWATEAFSRAHARQRPVLLSIVASWSEACQRMDADVFADPLIVALARDRVVPVRVDADRRPDLADRYGAGGWPTTLLLTPAGDPLCGGTYVDARQLAATIEQVAERMARQPEEIRRLALEARRARRAARKGERGEQPSTVPTPLVPSVPFGGGQGARGGVGEGSSSAALTWIASAIANTYDPQHAGFASATVTAAASVTGAATAASVTDAADTANAEAAATAADFAAGAKFPLAAPLAFALHYAQRTQDETLLTIATTTLDRMGWGGLSSHGAEARIGFEADAEADTDTAADADAAAHADAGARGDADALARGAFHRACAHPDWTSPDRAHLLDVQADMLRLYVEAWAITGVDRYRDRARAVWDYVDRVLHDREHGGFFHSELNGTVDRVLLTDANARMIRALLVASHLLDDVEYAKAAVRAAERLLPAVYGRGAGVAHVLDTHPRVRGLLTDQVHASAALLDLYDVTADRVYLDLSDELMRSCLRKLWTTMGDGSGAFFDRLPSSAGAGDVGLLAEPYYPFALNAEAARVLARLARESGETRNTGDTGGAGDVSADANTGEVGFAVRAADLRAWLTARFQDEGLLSAELGLLLLDDEASDESDGSERSGGN